MPLPMPGISWSFLGSSAMSGELDGGGLDGFGGAAVGADAEGIASCDFEQVGGLDEEIGDGAVVHAGIIGTRAKG